jgi:hypothetical protein
MVNKPKYIHATLITLWIITIYLMAQDYNRFPPLDDSNPLSDRINNLEGSLLKYGILSFIELIIGSLLIMYFLCISIYLRLFILLISIGFMIWVYIDAMYSGGVVATHVIWITVEMALVYFYIILISLKHRKIS